MTGPARHVQAARVLLLSEPAASVHTMLSNDPQALYRTRAKDGTMLYIGKSNAPLRRTEEHRRSKDWMAYNAVRIDLEWYPGLRAVLEAEARAIRTEHPVYNIQHNAGRIRIEAGISAEVSRSGSSVSGIFVIGACWASGPLTASRFGGSGACPSGTACPLIPRLSATRSPRIRWAACSRRSGSVLPPQQSAEPRTTPR